MIKLTDEQILAIERNGEFWVDGMPRQFARAIEAEVLRINGIGDANKMAEPETEKGTTNGRHDEQRPILDVGLPFCVHADDAMARGDVPSIADKLWNSDELMALNAELSLTMDQLVKFVRVVLRIFSNDALRAPRATGCPDTMDDTAQYAVDQKAAGEEKSPPATGPAG